MIFKKIAVLTSGGDAPGMNAAIRSITRSALKNDIEVMGVMGGYRGLVEDDLVTLTARDVSNTICRGGTILQTDRCVEFMKPEGMAKAVATCKKHNIDAVIAIGGDGTFRGATDLTNHGIPTIGVTGTIDNDITATDYTVGSDTAMNTVLSMVDRLRDTGESHGRCMVIEVMGRGCGEIALLTGIASGAVGTAIPEIPFDEDGCLQKIKELHATGKRNFLVIISEGVKKTVETEHYGETLTKRIQSETGIDTRYNNLGHVVRGGTPSLRDRVAASRMGEAAVELLLDRKSDVIVCELNGQIVPVEINFALALDHMYKNKLKDGDLDRFSPEQIEKMKKLCEEKREYIEKLYDLCNKLSR